jgi:transposase
MISLNPQSKVYIAIEPVDFRNGILGLKSLCKNLLRQDPSSGTFFVFRNKSKTSIKILVYNTNFENANIKGQNAQSPSGERV